MQRSRRSRGRKMQKRKKSGEEWAKAEKLKDDNQKKCWKKKKAEKQKKANY